MSGIVQYPFARKETWRNAAFLFGRSISSCGVSVTAVRSISSLSTPDLRERMCLVASIHHPMRSFRVLSHVMRLNAFFKHRIHLTFVSRTTTFAISERANNPGLRLSMSSPPVSSSPPAGQRRRLDAEGAHAHLSHRSNQNFPEWTQ